MSYSLNAYCNDGDNDISSDMISNSLSDSDNHNAIYNVNSYIDNEYITIYKENS